MRDWVFEKKNPTNNWIRSGGQKLNAKGVIRQHSSLGASDSRLFLVICFLTEMPRGEGETVIPGFLEASVKHSCSAVQQQLLVQTYPASISTGFLWRRPISASATAHSASGGDTAKWLNSAAGPQLIAPGQASGRLSAWRPNPHEPCSHASHTVREVRQSSPRNQGWKGSWSCSYPVQQDRDFHIILLCHPYCFDWS